MKPKYCKPTISSLPTASAAADGFEVLGVCYDGFNVGVLCSTGAGVGACLSGSLPQSSSGCGSGSGDTADIRGCYGGMNPSDGFPP